MNEVNQSNLPFAQSKRLFDRMAPYIGEALRAYPDAIVIDPRKESMAPETFASYFRKATTAKQMLDYKHPAVNESLFNEHVEHLVCAFGKNEYLGKLIVGPRNYGEVRQSVEITKLGASNQVEVNPIFVDEICKLVSQKALTPMPEFIVRELSQLNVDKYMLLYDVTIVPLDDTNKLHQIL